MGRGGGGGCLLYTSDAADEEDGVDPGGRRIIKKGGVRGGGGGGGGGAKKIEPEVSVSEARNWGFFEIFHRNFYNFLGDPRCFLLISHTIYQMMRSAPPQ